MTQDGITKSKMLLLLVLPMMIFNATCKNEHALDKKEAVNNLKILNSDIVNFIDKASEWNEIKAMEFLLKQSSSPLPIRKETSSEFYKHPVYSYQKNLGIYDWDFERGAFVKQKDTSVIVLNFTLGDRTKTFCKFFLLAYEAHDFKSKPEFPVRIEAKLMVNDKEELSISHQATVKEDLPAEVNTKIHGAHFDLLVHLTREGDFSAKNGILKGNIDFHANGERAVKAECKIKIVYHPPVNYSFQNIQFRLRVFESEVSGAIDYSKIYPAGNYNAAEFSSASNIVMKNLESDRIIGNIVLSPDDNSDNLDFFIRFSDGSQTKLSDYIIALNKILNYKF